MVIKFAYFKGGLLNYPSNAKNIDQFCQVTVRISYLKLTELVRSRLPEPAQSFFPSARAVHCEARSRPGVAGPPHAGRPAELLRLQPLSFGAVRIDPLSPPPANQGRRRQAASSLTPDASSVARRLSPLRDCHYGPHYGHHF